MVHIRTLVLFAALLPLGACSNERAGGGSSEPEPIPASALDLVGLSMNQGVEIRLLDGTDWIDHRNTSIVAGRAGILRVFVEPQADWSPRKVLATLDFDDGRSFTVDKTIGDTPSDEADLDSTINFELAAEDIVPDVGFSVRLEEFEPDKDSDGINQPYPGAEGSTRWPFNAEDVADLDARTSGALDIRVVPVRYNADGSGRLPDTSEAAVALLHDQMMKMYPTTEVRITVDDVLDWSPAVSPNGAGWTELLQQMYALRNQRNMPDDSYTYGLFAPATDQYTYCAQGCVAGLSINVQQANYADSRISIGLGYGDIGAAETMAHEIGHAHGRSHAPCSDFGSINNVDPDFPYSDARLGVVGYDILDGQLKTGNSNADIMGYCHPVWVSDYTWDAFYQRIRAVGPDALWLGQGPEQPMMSVLVGPDGLGAPKVLPHARRPIDGTLPTTARDADGRLVKEGTARFLPFDHLEGGLLVFPAPPEGATSVEVPGYGVVTL